MMISTTDPISDPRVSPDERRIRRWFCDNVAPELAAPAVGRYPDGPLRLTAEESAILAEMRAAEASDEYPRCPACGTRLAPDETHPLLPSLCGACSANALDELVMSIATGRRLRRRRAVRRLRRLARLAR